MNTACWESDPAISAWLAAQGMSPDDGYAYFVQRAADIALGFGRRPVQWSEVRAPMRLSRWATLRLSPTPSSLSFRERVRSNTRAPLSSS